MIDIEKVREFFNTHISVETPKSYPPQLKEVYPEETNMILETINELERLRKKETPMKPIEFTNGYRCPMCNSGTIRTLGKYCNGCGQKLLWESDEK